MEQVVYEALDQDTFLKIEYEQLFTRKFKPKGLLYWENTLNWENTYIPASRIRELKQEDLKLIREQIFPNWELMQRNVFLTALVTHCRLACSQKLFGSYIKRNSIKPEPKVLESKGKTKAKSQPLGKQIKRVTQAIKLGSINPSKFIFATLTFTKLLTEKHIGYVRKLLDEYIKNIKQVLNVPDLKFVFVIGLGSKGKIRDRIHVHAVIGISSTDEHKSSIDNLWGYGGVQCKDGYSLEVTEYLIKHLRDTRLEGNQCIVISQAIKKAPRLRGVEAEAISGIVEQVGTIINVKEFEIKGVVRGRTSVINGCKDIIAPILSGHTVS